MSKSEKELVEAKKKIWRDECKKKEKKDQDDINKQIELKMQKFKDFGILKKTHPVKKEPVVKSVDSLSADRNLYSFFC